MPSDYVLWRQDSEDVYCVLEQPNVDDIWELEEGISRAEKWPDDAFCPMSKDFPKQIQLADNLEALGLYVVSQRLKVMLESMTSKNIIEYLPVSIVNHKGRVASRDYWIVNPLDICDCIDIEKSNLKWNKIDSSTISYCKNLVLKPKAIPSNYLMFRMKYWPSNIVVKRSLVDKASGAGLSGLDSLEIEDYTGIE
jgi:hypothetical protein